MGGSGRLRSAAVAGGHVPACRWRLLLVAAPVAVLAIAAVAVALYMGVTPVYRMVMPRRPAPQHELLDADLAEIGARCPLPDASEPCMWMPAPGRKAGSTALIAWLSLLYDPAFAAGAKERRDLPLGILVPAYAKELHYFDSRPTDPLLSYAQQFPDFNVSRSGGRRNGESLDEAAQRDGSPAALLASHSFVNMHASWVQQLRHGGGDANEAMEVAALRSAAACGWDGATLRAAARALGIPLLQAAFLASHMTMEATPSYLIGVATMQRLRIVLPRAVVLVILRDPADRAFSEYQMKLRRIQGGIPLDNSTALAAAIAPLLEACSADVARGLWHATLSPDARRPSTNSSASLTTSCVRWAMAAEAQLLTLRRAIVRYDRTVPCIVARWQMHQRQASLIVAEQVQSGTEPTASSLAVPRAATLELITACLEEAAAAASADPDGAPPYEHVEVLSSVMRKEMTAVTACSETAAAPSAVGTTASLPPCDPVCAALGLIPRLTSLQRAVAAQPAASELLIAPSLLASRHLTAPYLCNEAAVARLQKAWGRMHLPSPLPPAQQPVRVYVDGRQYCREFGSAATIAFDFVPRSVYFGQLARLFCAVPAGDTLVLWDHQLRAELAATAANTSTSLRARVAELLSVAPVVRGAITQADVEARITRLFATLSGTGWRANSAYRWDDEELETEMRRFFVDYEAPVTALLAVASEIVPEG